MKKRLFCLVLGVLMLCSLPLSVLADEESDLEAQKAQNSEVLNETNSKLNDAQSAQSSLASEISDLDSQLVSLMSNIDVIKDDIQAAEDEIAQKETELKSAQSTCDTQYADMQTRIQYIYENGSGVSWISYVMKATSLADLVNRAEYAVQLNRYDRDLLAEYKNTVQDISDKKTSLEANEGELKEEQQSLEEQQTALNTALAKKKAQSGDYDTEIAALQAKADSVTAEIASQNARIREIEAEKQAAAAAAAAKAAAESKAAEEAAQSAAEASKSTEDASQAADSSTDSQDTAPAQDNQNDESSSSSSETPATPEPTVSPSSSDIGQQIADYACQFVGNPYVLGGYSLTNGCDCRGFVVSVFAHFGLDLMSSSFNAMAGMGQGVSLADAQPGDIVIYYGHIAIYIGNNTIVNASCPELGICTRSPANYRSVMAVRRLL